MKHGVQGRWVDNDLYVSVDGTLIAPGKSQRVINHSPDGFGAGYGGSAPAQTALGILLSLTNRETALKHYQEFKFQFLANEEYLEQDFEFTFDLEQWIAYQEKEHESRR